MYIGRSIPNLFEIYFYRLGGWYMFCGNVFQKQTNYIQYS